MFSFIEVYFYSVALWKKVKVKLIPYVRPIFIVTWRQPFLRIGGVGNLAGHVFHLASYSCYGSKWKHQILETRYSFKKIFLGNFNPRLKTGKIDACFSRQNGLRLVCPREETLRHMILYFPILWRNLCIPGMTFTYRAHLHGVGYPRQPSL